MDFKIQDDELVKMNNFCLKRDEKAKDSLVLNQIEYVV